MDIDGNGSYVNFTTENVEIPRRPDNSSTEAVQEFYYIIGILQTCIAAIGILFNALNIYVLVHLVRKRRGISPTYHLLIAMGVADLMVLFVMSFFYLNVYTRIPPLLFVDLSDNDADFYHVLHYVYPFFVNPFMIASNWMVVATTFFRFLAVASPMKVSRWCTLPRIRLSIALIFIMSVAINITDWCTIEAYNDGYRIRMRNRPLYDSVQAYYYVYFTFEIYIPFLVDLMLVIFLIINLNNTTASMAGSMQDKNAATREKEHRKISVMLIAIVLWFLLCNIPGIIYQIMRDTAEESRAIVEQKTNFKKFGLVKDFGAILNHGGNIVFYCLCNSTYRRMFFDTLLCRKSTLDRKSQQSTPIQASNRQEYVAKLLERRRESERSDRLTRSREASPFIGRSTHSVDNPTLQPKEQ